MKNKNYRNNEDSETQPAEQNKEAAELQQIKELGTAEIPKEESNIHCLTIIGQIEGHILLPPHNKTTKYEHIIPQLVAIEESKQIEGLLLVLNTVGGDVEAGLAISEMVSSLSNQRFHWFWEADIVLVYLWQYLLTILLLPVLQP